MEKKNKEKEENTMLNNVSLVGRLCNDPELRYTNNGTARCFFNLAVEKGTKDEVDFIPCVVWDKNAEALAQYKKKGEWIALLGRVSVHSFQNDSGYHKDVVISADRVSYIGYSNSKSEGRSQSRQEQLPTENPLPIDSTPLPWELDN